MRAGRLILRSISVCDEPTLRDKLTPTASVDVVHSTRMPLLRNRFSVACLSPIDMPALCTPTPTAARSRDIASVYSGTAVCATPTMQLLVFKLHLRLNWDWPGWGKAILLTCFAIAYKSLSEGHRQRLLLRSSPATSFCAAVMHPFRVLQNTRTGFPDECFWMISSSLKRTSR